MSFILGSAALLGAVGALVGWRVGALLRRADPGRRATAFRFVLAAVLVPYLLHVYWTYRFATGWIDLERDPEPIGTYPGAIAFGLFGLGLAAAVYLFALFFVSRVPLLTALYPGILFVGYFNLALPLVRWRAPFEGAILDNMPNIWLFLLFFGATSLLVVAAAVGLPRRRMPDGEM